MAGGRVLLGWLVAPILAAQAPGESLRAFLERRMGELKLVGAGLGVAYADGSTWSTGFGWADREAGRPARPETVALWASSSKVVTGLAAVKILQDKGIGLDAPIAPYLPFRVENPAFPGRAITFRMLLAHTSGILYDPDACGPLYGAGDAAMPLGVFLKEYLAPGGRYYRPTNYGPSAPGAAWAYSNIGYSLLGFLVERLAGMPFDAFCRKALFEPLGMRETAWRLRDLDPSHVALQYAPGETPGAPQRVPPYGWPGYPDGMLRGSVSDLLRLVGTLARGGRPDGPQAFREAAAAMFHPQGLDPAGFRGRSPLRSLDMGLAWRLIDLAGHPVWSHNGAGSGVSTLLLADDRAGSAAVAWITGGVLESPEGQTFFAELHHRLRAEMARAPGGR